MTPTPNNKKTLAELWMLKIFFSPLSRVKDNKMSEWLTPKVDDIDLTEDGKEVHIFFESDESGARYISIEGEALAFLKKLLKSKRQ